MARGLDWEKAAKQDAVRGLPKKRKRGPRATEKQRQLINKLLRELNYTGTERQEVWNEIHNPLDASSWIDELLRRKRE